MNQRERDKRDIEIMRQVRAGVAPRTIATRHRLTLNRVNQIIEREQWKREQHKRKRSRRSPSRARAAKAKHG